jgi:hypothetical protein
MREAPKVNGRPPNKSIMCLGRRADRPILHKREALVPNSGDFVAAAEAARFGGGGFPRVDRPDKACEKTPLFRDNTGES